MGLPRTRLLTVTLVTVGAVLGSWVAGALADASSASDPLPVSATVRHMTAAAATTGRGAGEVSVALVPAAVLGRRPPSVRGTGSFDFAASEGSIELHGAAGTEKVVFVPRAIFIRQPPPASGASPLPAGRSWVSAGLNEKPGFGSGLPLFVDQVEVVNVGLILDEIRWGAVTAKSLGATQVGGAGTQRYAVTVNLRQAQAGALAAADQPLAQAIGYQVQAVASKATSSAAVKVTVWVAPNGHVVEVQWSPPGGGVGTTSITISSLRTRLHVEAPPASQSVDVATLTPAGEKEGGLGDVA